MLTGKKSQVKHSNLAVSINGDLLEQVCSTKYLGVTVDSTLSWDSQCDNLCWKLNGKIAVLRRIRSFVKTETLKLLYEKTIQPVMDYACSVWCHTKKSNINKLQRVQNYAARIITGNFDYLNTNSIDLTRSLRWANVQERCDYFTAVLMYKAIHGLTPMYMTDNIVIAGETHDRDTRLSDSNDVNIPPHNSDVLKRSFIYNGSVIWNNLHGGVSYCVLRCELPTSIDFPYISCCKTAEPRLDVSDVVSVGPDYSVFSAFFKSMMVLKYPQNSLLCANDQ